MSGRATLSAGWGQRWLARHRRTSGRVPQELASALAVRTMPRPAPIHVAVLGSFSSGKTTIINRLLGERLAPTGALPTTRWHMRVGFSPAPSVRVFRPGASAAFAPDLLRQRWPLLRRWLEGQPVVDALPEEEGLAGAELVIGLPHPLLASGVVLHDTPGHDALSSADRECALGALREADAVLYVSRWDHILCSGDLEVLDQVDAEAIPWALVVSRLGSRFAEPRRLARMDGHARSIARRWRERGPEAVLWAPDPLPAVGGWPPRPDRRVEALVSRLLTWAQEGPRRAAEVD